MDNNDRFRWLHRTINSVDFQYKNYTVRFVSANQDVTADESIDDKPGNEEIFPPPNEEILNEFKVELIDAKTESAETGTTTTISSVSQSTKRVTVANIFISSHQDNNDSKTPMLTFAPHFEHNNYNIYVPEGKSEVQHFCTFTVQFMTLFGCTLQCAKTKLRVLRKVLLTGEAILPIRQTT